MRSSSLAHPRGMLEWRGMVGRERRREGGDCSGAAAAAIIDLFSVLDVILYS
jgi:hypothetical protein